MQSHDTIEKALDAKVKKREKKKKPGMKVSGSSVKKVQRIIKDKKS